MLEFYQPVNQSTGQKKFLPAGKKNLQPVYRPVKQFTAGLLAN